MPEVRDERSRPRWMSRDQFLTSLACSADAGLTAELEDLMTATTSDPASA